MIFTLKDGTELPRLDTIRHTHTDQFLRERLVVEETTLPAIPGPNESAYEVEMVASNRPEMKHLAVESHGMGLPPGLVTPMATEFLVSVVCHYRSNGWEVVSMDNSSALMVCK